MRRISVIGSSTGAGKTTFGRRLAERLNVAFVELDALHWGPDWTEPAPDDFRTRVVNALEGESWVADGMYNGKLGPTVWQRADTLVWLDLPLAITLWRVLGRTVRRVRRGEELWSGNRETIGKAFLSRDSLLVYAVRTYRGRRERIERRLASTEAAHLTVHRFRGSAEAERWLASLPAAVATS